MSRVQLALNVTDIEAAVEFSSKRFDAEPAKRRPGYANYAIVDPPRKLVLIESLNGRNEGVLGALNHLGVEVETQGDVRAVTTPVEHVRPIVDEIDRRVCRLLAELVPA